MDFSSPVGEVPSGGLDLGWEGAEGGMSLDHFSGQEGMGAFLSQEVRTWLIQVCHSLK